MDERDIIENAYRANVIRVIVCTSTLSSGVKRELCIDHDTTLLFALVSGESSCSSGDYSKSTSEWSVH